MRWLPLASALLLVSGCFHQGESDASDQFRERVNAICDRHETQLEALGKPPPGGAADRDEWQRAAERIARETAADFERLDAPADLDPALADWRRQVDVVHRRGTVASRAAEEMEGVDSEDVSEDDLERRAEEFAKAGEALQASAARLDVLARRASLNKCVDDER